MLTVQQRLGMVLGLLGQYDEAKQMLHEVAPALRECRAGRACCWPWMQTWCMNCACCCVVLMGASLVHADSGGLGACVAVPAPGGWASHGASLRWLHDAHGMAWHDGARRGMALRAWRGMPPMPWQARLRAQPPPALRPTHPRPAARMNLPQMPTWATATPRMRKSISCWR